MGAPKTAHEIELSDRQHAWLREMADRHGLADEGKVVRCLINYAIDEPDREDDIFGTIRCPGC